MLGSTLNGRAPDFFWWRLDLWVKCFVAKVSKLQLLQKTFIWRLLLIKRSSYIIIHKHKVVEVIVRARLTNGFWRIPSRKLCFTWQHYCRLQISMYTRPWINQGYCPCYWPFHPQDVMVLVAVWFRANQRSISYRSIQSHFQPWFELL